MKQEVNSIARGFLHLMNLLLIALMKAQRLLKLTPSKPDPGLVDSTPSYLNVAKTCITPLPHCHVQFQLAFLYLRAISFRIMNGISILMNASTPPPIVLRV